MEQSKPKPVTPCGYPAGPVKAGDGTLYLVRETGQIVRARPKMGKAERKRHKKERRRSHETPAPGQ